MPGVRSSRKAAKTSNSCSAALRLWRTHGGTPARRDRSWK
jgi:hypothetical protein